MGNELKCCPFCGGALVFVEAYVILGEEPCGFFQCENMCFEQCHVRFKNDSVREVNRRYEPRQGIEFDYGAED